MKAVQAMTILGNLLAGTALLAAVGVVVMTFMKKDVPKAAPILTGALAGAACE